MNDTTNQPRCPRRSRDEKRRLIQLLLADGSKRWWSNSRIAEELSIGRHTVGKLRRELHPEPDGATRRRGLDGKFYPARR